MDKDILFDISAGMYILSTNKSACFVDAVMQVSSGDAPLIAVAVMKDNYTNKIMKEANDFVISIFGMDNNPNLIKTFGMNSSKDIDKFENIEFILVNDIKVPIDSIGYIYLEKVNSIDNDTHTLFIGRVINKKRFSDSNVMTYQYYQEKKNELLEIETEENKTAWVCEMCGYIHYGEELPDDFVCPKCKMPKSVFKKVGE